RSERDTTSEHLAVGRVRVTTRGARGLHRPPRADAWRDCPSCGGRTGGPFPSPSRAGGGRPVPKCVSHGGRSSTSAHSRAPLVAPAVRLLESGASRHQSESLFPDDRPSLWRVFLACQTQLFTVQPLGPPRPRGVTG